MNVTRIYIISGHLLFSHGLESLLEHHRQFEIVGQEKEMAEALEQIKELEPDVVILDSDDSVAQVTPILHAREGIRVISLSLRNNDLYVYQAKQRLARETKDLVDAIKNDLYDIKTLGGKGSNEEPNKYSR